MRDDPPVTDLVTRARTGDKQAWDAIVDRYAPLVWSICRYYQLGAADAQHAGQSVWLHLAEQLSNLRDPAALPGWLATTTRHECARALRAANRPQAAAPVPDMGNIPDELAVTSEQELLAAERHAALREALTHLPPRGQQLLALLIHDPPLPAPRSAPPWALPSAVSGRCADATCTSFAATRPSQPWSTPKTASAADERHGPAAVH
jgi:RNA polymerase sigma factor (sigma-70 family)